jgi:collagenase-like PrtC family protease
MQKDRDTKLGLTMGPLLFNWQSSKIVDFYARIADEAPVDAVCIGEVVCSKRHPLRAAALAEVCERLHRARKTVVLSTLALATLPRELRELIALVEQDEFAVEVNDQTALAYMREARPFRVGPFVNLYNESTLDYFAQRGASHVCYPPELSLAAVEVLSKRAAALHVKAEVWGFGRVPLALSGRCYHARLQGLNKDSCQFVCERDADGLDVRTLDEQRLLAINGVQTLSQSYCNVIGDTERLAQAGVNSIRLSPHSCDMVAVAEAFRQRLDGRIGPGEAQARMSAICGPAIFSNGFLFGASGLELVTT